VPTSKENLAAFKSFVQQMTDDHLVEFAKKLDSDWEIPGVDVWVEEKHRIPTPAAIQSQVTTLSLSGLKRLREHFSSCLEVIDAELTRRKTRKGPPIKGATTPMWMISILYDALINRKKLGEAQRLLTRFDVNKKTLKRYRDDPHRDER